MSKIFVDTNILVYSLQRADNALRRKARERLTDLRLNHQGVISTQVMQEFYVVCKKKLGVDPVLIKRILQKFENMEVITVDSRLIYEGIDCSITNGLSFWDGLIVAAAQDAGCDILWTQDMNPGQSINDLLIENPLS